MMPDGRKLFACEAVEVLGRTHLEPRKYLALVRVGRKVLLLGVTPEGMNRVGEIDAPEEIAELLEVARPKTETGRQLFVDLFRRHLGRAEAEKKAEETRRGAEAVAGDMAQLKERARALGHDHFA